MSWIMAGGAAIGLASGAGNYFAGRKAAGEMEEAQKAMERAQQSAIGEIEGYSNDYVNMITKLNADFDMYDMEEAFGSLYEAVIQPMERDFDENVLPGIQAAYAGGIMGQGAGMSGAQASAESQAQRGLSETKAQLRAGERDKAIDRNVQEFNRESNSALSKFSAQTIAPNMKFNAAGGTYDATTNTIGASLAANQAGANIALSGVQGAQAGMSIAGSLNQGGLPNAAASLNGGGDQFQQSSSQRTKSLSDYQDYLRSIGR